MALSNELISQFVKATKSPRDKKKEEFVYGTVIEKGKKLYIKLDGSDVITPASSTVNVKVGERVSVLLKNHSATITGNISAPAARGEEVDEAVKELTDLKLVVSDKASIGELEAGIARIETLEAENVTIKGDLTAANADIESLKAKDVEVTGKLEATEAEIENLNVTKLSVDVADLRYASIEKLNATDAEIHNLKGDFGEFKVLSSEKFTAVDAEIKRLDADKITFDDLEGKYANIDFSNIGEAAIKKLFADTGLIKDLIVGDGTITGELIGVTIKGDLIEGNTIVADKLVIKGSDGLYYKLNTDGITTEAEQTEYNSLNGQVIRAKSVTASKIAVDDLVAFDATIAGLHLTDGTIYSGVKTTVDNSTRGFYLDEEGQMSLGDSSNFLKYFKNQNGLWELAISAGSILLSSSGKDIETELENLNIVGDNLAEGTNNGTKNWWYAFGAGGVTMSSVEVDGINCVQFARDTVEATSYTVFGYSACSWDLIKPGTYYTVSFQAKCTEDTKYGIHFNTSGGSYPLTALGFSKTIPANTWGEVVCVVKTFDTFPDNYPTGQNVYINSFNANINVVHTIRNLKVEEGQKATLWRPSPRDSVQDLTGEDIIAKINLTSAAATILASKINLTGYVTFDNLSASGQTAINADNLTTGTIRGRTIITNSGKIAGFNIYDKGLYNNDVSGQYYGMSDYGAGWAFWAGSPTNTIGGADAAFRVGHSGRLICTNAEISGNIYASGGQIGAWTITHAEVNNGAWGTGWGTGFGQKNGASWNPNEMAFWAGDGKFRVNYDGTLRSTSANITGTIDATSIRIKNTINMYDSDGVNRIALTAPIGSAGSSLNVGSGFQSVYIKGCIFRNGVLQVGEDTSFTLATGFVNSQGQITANLNLGSTAQFRAVCGNYGFLIRNDGVNTYFMTTNSGDPDGSWAPNKWFRMTMSSGVVYFDQGIRTADLGGGGLLPVINTRTDNTCIYRMAALSATRIDVATKAHGVNRITTASSDVRLKENITDTEVNALSVIDRIKMRQFDWKANKDHWSIGMIADELETLDSKLTIGGGYDVYGNIDVKSIDTFYMLGYVVKGIQELHALLTDLEKRIQKLERR